MIRDVAHFSVLKNVLYGVGNLVCAILILWALRYLLFPGAIITSLPAFLVMLVGLAITLYCIGLSAASLLVHRGVGLRLAGDQLIINAILSRRVSLADVSAVAIRPSALLGDVVRLTLVSGKSIELPTTPYREGSDEVARILSKAASLPPPE